jgi:lipopolysaccharide transport system permease protein
VTNYEQIIEPTRGWRVIDWRALVHYRDLLYLMVRRDFVAKYKQTVLGPAWFIIQPLITTLMFTVVFGRIAKIPTDGIPGQVFYLCNLLAWTYFAQSLPTIATSLITNAALFSKVYFPRLIVPLAALVSNLLAFGLQLVTFLGFYFYFKFATPEGAGIHANLTLLALPLLILHTALISLGFGLWLAALTAKYRDFTHLMAFLVQLWMYATPVILPLRLVPEKLRLVFALNPMTAVVESFRYAFFSRATVNAGYLGLSVAITLVVLISGLLVFSRVEKTFVDVV